MLVYQSEQFCLISRHLLHRPMLVYHIVHLCLISRRLLHRPMLVYRMPNLMAIDGIPVSEEERTKAELYFLEQQPASVTGPPGLDTGALPGAVTGTVGGGVVGWKSPLRFCILTFVKSIKSKISSACTDSVVNTFLLSQESPILRMAVVRCT